MLYVFSLLFILAVIIRKSYYSIFSNKVFKSEKRIISVGNITTGGSGKTPFSIFLAKYLISQNHNIAIVLRGYKSNIENQNTLVNSENLLKAGDEAALYFNNLPNIPICIGKDRVKSIKYLEENFPNLETIIMDDAYQHLKVKQDIKICVFNSNYPIGNGFCLPAGILREPFNSLKYGNVFIINGYINDLPEKFINKLKKFNKPIIYSEYKISDIKDFQGNTIDINSLKDKSLMLMSGIGSPKSFEKTIEKHGLSFREHLILNDHFDYTTSFLAKQKNLFNKHDFILITEKDYSKLKSLKLQISFLVIYVKLDIDTNLIFL